MTREYLWIWVPTKRLYWISASESSIKNRFRALDSYECLNSFPNGILLIMFWLHPVYILNENCLLKSQYQFDHHLLLVKKESNFYLRNGCKNVDLFPSFTWICDPKFVSVPFISWSAKDFFIPFCWLNRNIHISKCFEHILQSTFHAVHNNLMCTCVMNHNIVFMNASAPHNNQYVR